MGPADKPGKGGWWAGLEGQKREVPEEGEERLQPSPVPMGEGMAELTVNSSREAEAQRGADTGLRPTEIGQAGRGHREDSGPVVGAEGTPVDPALCSPLWETLRGALMGRDRQEQELEQSRGEEG